MDDCRMTKSSTGSLVALGMNRPPNALDIAVAEVRRKRCHHQVRVRKGLSPDNPEAASAVHHGSVGCPRRGHSAADGQGFPVAR